MEHRYLKVIYLLFSKDASELTDQTAPLDEVIATVDELLRTVDSSDPKFKNSKANMGAPSIYNFLKRNNKCSRNKM